MNTSFPRLFLFFLFCTVSVMAQSPGVYTSSATKTKKVVLPDGSEVWLNVKSTLRLGKEFNVKQRTVHLSGDAFFKIKQHKTKPFIIRTAQLILTTHEASLRVDAYPSPGEEADVLTGTVKAKKSYYSKLDNEEYTLTKGQMVMINRDIDLIEKEKFDSTELKTWLKRF